jgi:DNA-binding winged helix-turn-helix (wHTH) protein/tetratricopeptide (TPR) repeat protein
MAPDRKGPVSTPPAPAASRSAEDQAYSFGAFKLLPHERILLRGDKTLSLPPKAFEILLLLVRNAGHLMSKEELMKQLWPDSFVEEVNLANNVSVLRKVLGDKPSFQYIQTVPKAGYRFLPAVTRIWSARSESSPVQPDGAQSETAFRLIALPFQMVRADETVEFLSFTLPEAISASLAGLRSITVRSTLLAARLAADGTPDLRRIAAEADVDLLLTGTILCAEQQLRVTAELVQAPSGTLLGSFTCETDRDQIFHIHDSVVRRVVEMLTLRLSGRELRFLKGELPVSPRAYEFYLRANHAQLKRTVPNVLLARDLYRACVEEDPDYAPAWARLGRCYRFLQKFGQEGPQNLELAQWAFHRAFALNPDLPIAHNLYTQIEADLGNAQTAMVRLLNHAETHPNDPELFGGLVQACRFCGLLGESVQAHERARRLDARAVTSVSHTYFLLGEYERALESYDSSAGYYLDAAILALTGRETEAIALLDERGGSDVHAGWMRAAIASLRACLKSDYGAAIAVIQQALCEPARDPELKFYFARHLARGGDTSTALEVIGSLVPEGFFCSVALELDPWLQGLRGKRGYQDVRAAILQRESEARVAYSAVRPLGVTFAPQRSGPA